MYSGSAKGAAGGCASAAARGPSCSSRSLIITF